MSRKTPRLTRDSLVALAPGRCREQVWTCQPRTRERKELNEPWSRKKTKNAEAMAIRDTSMIGQFESPTATLKSLQRDPHCAPLEFLSLTAALRIYLAGAIIEVFQLVECSMKSRPFPSSAWCNFKDASCFDASRWQPRLGRRTRNSLRQTPPISLGQTQVAAAVSRRRRTQSHRRPASRQSSS